MSTGNGVLYGTSLTVDNLQDDDQQPGTSSQVFYCSL